jgi:hypothetical protein
MRGFAFIGTVAAINVLAANAFAAEKIRLAQTSTVTNCMMSCNAQAASCRTNCLLPPPAASGAGATNIPTATNATANTTCTLSCGTTQLACQSNCGLQSPSP